MRKLLIILVLSVFYSCGLFESQEQKTNQLVEKELNAIDWNAVDAYPIFEFCDETLSKEEQRNCFEEGLLEHFSKTLSKYEFDLKKEINPIVKVDFVVDKKGQIIVVNIEKDEAINEEMPRFDRIIRQSLLRIPPLAPAIKNRVPVKTKFRIPILLKTNRQPTTDNQQQTTNNRQPTTDNQQLTTNN